LIPAIIKPEDEHKEAMSKLIVIVQDIYSRFGALDESVYDFINNKVLISQTVTSVDSDNTSDSDSHTRLHSMNGTADHTSPGGTENNLVDFDSSGYPVNDSGLSVTDTSDAITKKHDRQHAIDATADHTSTITEDNIMTGDGNGLPQDSGVAIGSVTNVWEKVGTLLEPKTAGDTVHLDSIADADVALDVDAVGASTDVILWRVGSSDGAGAAGWWLSYVGSGTGVANYLDLIAHGAGGGQVTAYRFDQAGNGIIYKTLTTGEGRLVNTTRVTTTYTILTSDHIIYCDTDGGDFTVTLPIGVEGQHLKIINCGSNTLTVDPNGTEQLYGSGAGVASDLSNGEIINIHFNTTEGWW